MGIFSKKHYDRFAQEYRIWEEAHYKDGEDIDVLAFLIDVFAKDNEKFDKDRFADTSKYGG